MAEARADDVVDLVPCGYLTTTADGLVLRANDELLAWTGRERGELEGRVRFVDLLTPGSRMYHESHYAPLLRLQGEVREVALTLRGPDGTRLPSLVSSRVVDGLGGDGEPLVVTAVFAARERRRYEEELLQERRRADAASAHLARMQETALRLALVTGLAETQIATVRSAIGVGRTAVAALWMPDPDGWGTSLRARATAADVERPTGSAPGPAGRPAAPGTGPAPGVPVADDLVVLPWVAARAQVPIVADALATPDEVVDGPRAVVLVPLRDGPRRLGLLACRLDDAGDLDDVEADALRILAHQAGTALTRALLHDQQREAASTLQHRLLPDRLPTSDRYALARVYEPGLAGAQVGGDWYDAYALDEHRLAVVVGDVVGRGLEAAATMGQLRSALRAVAPGAGGPGEVLNRLDLFVDAVGAGLCSTVVLAVLDLRTSTLAYACAGHPPPLLLDPAGEVRTLWQGRSLPLGLAPEQLRGHAEVPFPAGSTLLLYTDGLVERRGESLPGRLDELAGVLAATAGDDPQRRVDTVREAMLGPVHTGLDDVCLLGLTTTRS